MTEWEQILLGGDFQIEEEKNEKKLSFCFPDDVTNAYLKIGTKGPDSEVGRDRQEGRKDTSSMAHCL